jgi:prepilin-type N-terminal cleavage/methylation domain-containing protein
MKQRGFTIVEILVVVGVIGVIGVLAAFAVAGARSRSRDAVRLSEVRQVQSALENYFTEQNQYPPAEGLLPLGDARVSGCLSDIGFEGDCAGRGRIYLRVVQPTVDTGLSGLSVCGTPARNAFCFASLREGSDYRIQFELENDWRGAGLAKGLACATPGGMSAGPCRQ